MMNLQVFSKVPEVKQAISLQAKGKRPEAMELLAQYKQEQPCTALATFNALPGRRPHHFDGWRVALFSSPVC